MNDRTGQGGKTGGSAGLEAKSELTGFGRVLRDALIITSKDLRVELRSKEILLTMGYSISVGERVRILPDGLGARVRGVQVHGRLSAPRYPQGHGFIAAIRMKLAG